MEGVPEAVGIAGRVAACSPGPGWSESPDSLDPVREATGESDLAQSLERYHRGLRDRASKSLDQLKYVFHEKDPAIGESTATLDQLFPNSGQEVTEDNAWQELQYSHAVNQLKALLRQQEEKGSEMSPSKKRGMSPTEEISELKARIHVIVVENGKLQNDLKMETERTLREQTILNASTLLAKSGGINGDHSHICGAAKASCHVIEQAKAPPLELEKWQQELEKLKYLHEEKTEVFEAQIQSLRKALSESQKNCEELRGRLKHQHLINAANSSNRPGGLCLNCAQHEAVLSQTHSNVHMQTIERLTNERDELMAALSTTRRNLNDMQQRECSAYEQVKQAVHMSEEANLEKTKALIQCEQLKNEMERQKDRLEKELVLQLDKRAGEREAVREEMKKEKENLSSLVMSLSQNVAGLESQIDRITREKISLTNQLEEAQNHHSSREMEINKVCGEIHYELNETKMKKDEAEKEHREYRTKTIRELEIKDQQIEKLQVLLHENKQRLEQAQQDTAKAKEECLKLTELLGKAEQQLHFLRLEKENIQHSFSNEAKTRVLQAQQREQDLTQKMRQMEAQHDKTVNELESLLSSQNALLSKLKEECCQLAKKVEHVTERKRSEISQLSQENEYIHDRLEKVQKRHDELEDQCIQHGRMHEKMKLRLHQLDKHCQSSAQQLVELLNKQNELYKERQMLTEEVDFLQTQLSSVPQP
ncbi:PREDICTED: serologically defined colon cancer antigen 8 isoform X2 [Thamnophis sirtalis]|uniref:Serologically defined colon cancer antigen 8 isoform X2 n=1 Tax=Thamnophis sirtalis TaxID=35019 RepID=A0A6I9YG55_9SAUR|nr:PREDICTED: serologically defined colon cancer antigen 8 isoform X2 [Thamnophis sirtalis]